MTRAKYSLLAIFTIALIIILWIFFPNSAEDRVPQVKEFQMAENALSRQVPRDNDSNYSFPTYIPTHNHSQPREKIQFNSSGDNDALYSLPVAIPTETVKPAPQKAPIKFVEQPKAQSAPAVTPVAPVAPLQPQPRQPETPVYVPEYQQPQYQQQYEEPAQQAQPPATNAEEVYPLYYY